MNIFLTGEIQIGKTTIIQKTIKLLNRDYGGFRTYFGPDRDCPNRLLYMNSIREPYNYSDDLAIVRLSESSKPQIIENRFNLFGAKLIRDAVETKELIIMDECGKFERDSLEFQNQIFKALELDTPILGVIKLESTGWVDYIRNHPRVELITVTEENRNILPRILAERFNQVL